MIDLTILKDKGITVDALKGRFNADESLATGTADEKDKVKTLHNRIRSRVQEGMSRNLADWQWIYAIDKAWDTPFRQFHPKLFADLEAADLKNCCSILQSLNLGNLIETYKGPDGKDCHRVNEEKFQLLVGLCRSYTTIRWAKIVNDRRLTPFFKFEAAKATTVNRAKCEVLTDRVQVMADQYSYFEVMKQSVLKMLQYSYSLKFIREAWHDEKQLRRATAQDVESGKKKAGTNVKCSVGDLIEIVDKEGLRYHIPHLSRVFRDLAHPLYTINSDSGCMFAGNWEIARYREALAAGFWNTDKISLGNTSIVDANSLFFQTVGNKCRMSMPLARGPEGGAQAGAGIGPNDREKELANQFYGSDHLDQGVLLVNYFEKLIPSENGLGDYDYPVWFQFTLAGDCCTILYVEPLPAIPCVYYGYDADESRAKNPSLVMEILPYQYEFENLLTQIIQSCKQNLANFTMVNTDLMDDAQVKAVESTGPNFWQKLNLFGVSFKKISRILQRSSASQQDMGVSLALPKANIAELVNVLKTVLDVLERVLVMSSHEVAQAASHEQTREEVRNIASSTSSRLTFTATPVDIARDAWKRQIYAYLMAYGDDDFYGHIPADNEITKKQLEKLGFSYVDDDAMTGKEKFRRVKVSKSNLLMPLYEFASTRDGEDRTSDTQIATVMATFARDLLQNPITAQAIGPDQAIEMANKIAYFAGLPRDFKLRNVGGTPEQQQEKAQAELKSVVEQVLQVADQHIIKAMQAGEQKMEQAITPVLEKIKEIETAVVALEHITGNAPPMIPQIPNATPETIPAAPAPIG